MNDTTNSRKSVRILLENTMRIVDMLIKKGLLDAEEGRQIFHCLKGIRQRFLSADYMERSPVGADMDEIDQMILPLDQILLEAAKKGYKTTISYIIKTIICGAGAGHKILTDEEQQEAAVVLVKRKDKVSQYLNVIQTAQKLDEQLSLREQIMDQQELLEKNYLLKEKKVGRLLASSKDIMEEILYYMDTEDLSADAVAYLDLNSSMAQIKSNISKKQKQLDGIDNLIQMYQSELREKLAQMGQDNQQSGQETEPDRSFEEKMAEIQKITDQFIDEDGPDMIDLAYEAMEQAFSSREMNDYVAQIAQEFEDSGLSEAFTEDDIPE